MSRAPLPPLGYMPTCGDPHCAQEICHPSMKTLAHHHSTQWWENAKPVREALVLPDPVQLMKVGIWVLEKHDEESEYSEIFHYCPDLQWKSIVSYETIKNIGYCEDCHEDIPEEMIAAYTMHNWKHIQNYPQQVPRDPFAVATMESGVKVYR